MARPKTVDSREKKFAMHIARGEHPSSAMRNAGYAEGYILSTGPALLLRRPRVKAEIERYRAILKNTKESKGTIDLGRLPKELQQALSDKMLTAEQLEEIKKCALGRRGMTYWLKNYVWTWDRANKRKAKYPLWPYQRQFLKELEDGGRILVEKSRDLMVTWTACEHILWHLQFDPFWTGFATSRRESEVDNGGSESTTASIFGRIRFSWMEQPDWLRTDLRFAHLKVINQEEGMYAELLGESANPNVGRSSDAFFKWGDEFALVEQSERAHASMVGGGFNTLLYTSTSNLTGNEFYRLRSKKDSGFRILRYLWNQRPGRDKKWYADKSASLTDEQRAKELDVKFEISGPSLIWKNFDPRLHVRPREEMPVEVGRAFLGFDEGYAHPGALYYARYWDGTLYIVDEIYEASIQLLHPDDMRDQDNKDWAWIVEEMIEKHGPVETICIGNESRGFEAILVSRGHDVYRVGKDHLNRIRLVDGLMSRNGKGQPGLIIDEECVKLLKEIPKFRWKSVGGLLQDVPASGDDHAVDAIQCIAEYVLDHEEEDDGGDWVSAI